jgi:hypothetical protein
MPYVMFGTKEEFALWHEQKCLELGIPRPGKNANSGVENVNACWTTAWIEPVYVKGGVAAKFTEAEIAADPRLARLPLVEPVLTTDEFGTKEVTEAVEFTWTKPVPDTYVVGGKTVTVDKTKAVPSGTTATKTATTTTKVK